MANQAFFKQSTRDTWNVFGGALRRGEATFSLALIAILLMLILPVPKMLLDFCLALSLAFSVLVLMTVLFLEKPLQFSIFPTVLLVATMLRLSLNVASTRLILSSGHDGTAAAGQVIQAFGDFIMRGNFLIGMIVFAILVIINFVVITKGSGRIAEVVARFSLDALPGKQMAVDADLSSGLIDQDEAKKRRKQIQEETNFYGAMDGAAKFVRGDAIAGLLITFINLIGGILIGVAQQGLGFSQAAQTYSVLTVGDGLVTQVPALIISIASGMLISKASSEGTTNQAFGEQLGAYPVALGLSGVLMACLGLLPGVPALPFFALASLAGLGAWRMSKPLESQNPLSPSAPAGETASEGSFEQTLSEVMKVDPVKLELGIGLLSFVKDPNGLILRVKSMRHDLASQLGVLIPSVRIVDNFQLDTFSYVIKVKEIEAASGRVYPQRILALSPTGDRLNFPGEEGIEPVFGLPGLWIDERLKEAAESQGCLITDPVMLLATHLTEVLKDYIPELLSFSVVQQLIDQLPKPVQKLYVDMVPNQLPPTHFQRILQNLLAERISIRDFGTIVEAISDGVQVNRTPEGLTEFVRSRLSRQICGSLLAKNGTLPLLTLSGLWENEFQNALSGDGEARQLILPPSRMQLFLDRVGEVLSSPQVQMNTPSPAVVTTPGIRPHVRSVLTRLRPQLTVISQNELSPRVQMNFLGEI